MSEIEITGVFENVLGMIFLLLMDIITILSLMED